MDVCFLNYYDNEKNHIGWHADDSPEMDNERPIVIISLGAEREFWTCPKNNKENVTKMILGNGSACVMLPHMQESFFHRIPKAGFKCGPRISLTYRGYLEPHLLTLSDLDTGTVDIVADIANDTVTDVANIFFS